MQLDLGILLSVRAQPTGYDARTTPLFRALSRSYWAKTTASRCGIRPGTCLRKTGLAAPFLEVHPLSAPEARVLLEAARDNRLEALYVLAVHTGMRRGELLGLKWEDVDLDSSTIRVRRTLTRVENGRRLALGEPKTKKSRRTVRLTPRAVEALRCHRARQAEEKLKTGGIYEDQGLVFAGEVGNLINPSNLRQRSFAPLLRRAGLPQITFHDLRHTCASLLFQRNVHPKFVQELLGHASVAITLDTYSHMLPGMGGEAADAIDEALG